MGVTSGKRWLPTSGTVLMIDGSQQSATAALADPSGQIDANAINLFRPAGGTPSAAISAPTDRVVPYSGRLFDGTIYAYAGTSDRGKGAALQSNWKAQILCRLPAGYPLAAPDLRSMLSANQNAAGGVWSLFTHLAPVTGNLNVWWYTASDHGGGDHHEYRAFTHAPPADQDVLISVVWTITTPNADPQLAIGKLELFFGATLIETITGVQAPVTGNVADVTFGRYPGFDGAGSGVSRFLGTLYAARIEAGTFVGADIAQDWADLTTPVGGTGPAPFPEPSGDEPAVTYGVARYARQMQQLLPRGRAWEIEQGGWFTKLLLGLAEELARVDVRAKDLLDEWDPSTADETLADWERVLGLPDACGDVVPDTLEDRRAAVVARLLSQGGQSRAYFIGIAAALGFTATIVEHGSDVFRAGDRINRRVGGTGWAFTWTMVIEEPAGGLSDYLECIVSRLTPAHTRALFTYGS